MVHLNELRKIVQSLELSKAFDDIEAENCSLCCNNTNGGTSGGSGC